MFSVACTRAMQDMQGCGPEALNFYAPRECASRSFTICSHPVVRTERPRLSESELRERTSLCYQFA